MYRMLSIALAAALSLPTLAHAADDTDGWSGQGELGYAASTGNTDTRNLVAKAALQKKIDLWTYGFGAAGQWAKEDGEETAKRYEFFGNAARDLNSLVYLKGAGRSERDHFSAYKYQTTAAAAVGFHAINTDRTKLDLEIGPGYRWAKLYDTLEEQNGAVARGWADFSTKLTDTTSLFDTLLVESGSDNTYLQNDLGLQVQMSSALALKLAYQVRRNSDVDSVDTKKTDTLTTVNLVYGF
ncbi:MAG: DUF481 domain-containing protein [Pseudoxanthomonas sp.]